MGKPSVYVETSVIGYATSRRSRDLVVATRQKLTQDWFAAETEHLDLYISQMVIDEISVGDPEAVRDRLEFVGSLPILELTPQAGRLASNLLEAGALPAKAKGDALHVAIAADNGMDFLVTWNCRHIANAFMRPVINRVCIGDGFTPPIICTPEELLNAARN